MIEINFTLIYQIVGFFILLYVLNRFLYKPLERVLEERERRIGGTLKEASDIEDKVKEGLVEYERRLKEAAAEGQEERNRIKEEATRKEQSILEDARKKATEEIDRVKNELAREKTLALERLREEAKTISKNIAQKILERDVGGFAVLLLSLSLFPSISFASGQAHDDGGAMFWRIINFVILATVIYLVWVKIIKVYLDGRAESIKEAIDSARMAKERAEAKEREYKEKLKLLDKKVEEIRTSLRLEGEAEKERIIKEAEKASLRIMEQARLTAEQEIRKAKIEIQKEVGMLAVRMAEEILRKEMTPQDQERLVRDYLKKLRFQA